jgi:hypothetical protein
MTNAKTFNDLTFGCEIEFVGTTRDVVYRAIVAAGVPCELHPSAHMPRANRNAWVVCPDGSVSGGEVVSPILQGVAGLEALAKVCNAATAAGAKIDKNCGFHVHVGARNVLTLRQMRNLAKMFLRHEAAFDQIVSASRRAGANTYCGRAGPSRHASTNAVESRGTIEQKFAYIDNARTIPGIAAVMNGGFVDAMYSRHRYFSLNLQSYARHGTVEFRQHQGTVDAQKACEWVKLVVGFVARATQVDGVKSDPTPATLDELLRKTDAAGRRFYIARAAYFARRAA